MKDLPDQKLWDKISGRLSQYAEEPDEKIWKGISNSLRKQREPGWPVLLNRVTLGLIIGLLGYLSFDSYNDTAIRIPSNNVVPKEQKKFPDGVPLYDGNSNPNPNPNKDTDQQVSNAKIISPAMEHKMDLVPAKNLSTTSGNGSAKLAIVTNADFNLPAPVTFGSSKSDSLDRVHTDSTELAVVESLSEEPETIVEETEKKKKRRRKMKFYGIATPFLTYQRIQPLRRDNVEITGLQSPSVLSMNRFALALEAGVQGKILPRLEYYAGVSYYRQRQTLRYSYLSDKHVRVNPDGDLNFEISPGYDQDQVNYSMNNVGIQAGILYTLVSRSLSHKIGGGLMYQYGSIKSAEEQPYDNSKSSYLFYHILYRNEVTVNRSFGIFFQPVFQYAVFARERLNAPFKLQPYRAGLSFGVTYHFKAR